MSSRRNLWIIATLALSGCAQSGPLLSKGTGVGTLKTSLSHMEYENQQLKREVASMKSELRQTEDRLVQEESASEDLSSRLGNAMALLKRKGIGEGEMADTGADRPSTTLPAGRSTRKPRKPPFAQIPGRIDALPSGPEGDETSSGWGTSGAETDRQSRRIEDPAVWLPVARGSTSSADSRR